MLRGRGVVPTRPLGFREAIDYPFAVIQANLALLAALTGIAVAIGASIVSIAAVVVAAATGEIGSAVEWTVAGVTLFVAWLARVFLATITTTAAVLTYTQAPVTWRTVRSRSTSSALVRISGLQRSQIVIAVGVLSAIVLIADDSVAIGVLLLVFLGFAVLALVYFGARNFVAVPAVIVENITTSQATQRSRALTTNAIGRMLGLWITMYSIVILLVLPIASLPQFVIDAVGGPDWVALLLTVLGFQLIAGVSIVVESSTRAVSYFDRRCTREGADIYGVLGATLLTTGAKQ
ncbi:hypothetical protein ACHIPZ_11450 [Antrihabitans sp. NCIMB 15449]|uniref:Glycerophosphoryl diester phosphodiesterase membrane domain-containing protein n=1 Tax=Antrihabitans spumae TaxID=3373370 RepID=A0ABW7JM14_9NOCA